MLSPYWRGLYHFHLHKCGGTTLNGWLDGHACDRRLWKELTLQEAWRALSAGIPKSGHPEAYGSWARMAFRAADIVHTHRFLLPFAPGGTFRMTVLREPVARLVSSINDRRGLRPHDVVGKKSGFGRVMLDAGRMPLADYLATYGDSPWRRHFDNPMTRWLALWRSSTRSRPSIDAAELLPVALTCLEEFDFVGLTEELDLTRNAIASRLGFVPVGPFPRLNVKGSQDLLESEGAGVAPLLARLTRHDAVLYERARQLFGERHRDEALAYTDGVFEERHAAAVTGLMRGTFEGGAMRHRVGEPLLGRGFYPRDGPGLPECAVWSGPDPMLVLYMPVLPGEALSILLWIRGYASIEQRARLRVWLDGEPVTHRFEPASGYAEVMVCDHRTRREFVRLEVDVGETVTSGQPGSSLFDPRRRGLAFDAYGWRLNAARP